MLDMDLAAAAIRAEGFESVSVEASNIPGSPYRYVYVYLTPEKIDGPHVLVSDQQELEADEGYLVGPYRSQEDFDLNGDGDEIEAAATTEEMVALIKRQAEEMS